MPVKHVGGGRYRYGRHGKVYSGRGAKAKAQRQGRAIEMSRHGKATKRKR